MEILEEAASRLDVTFVEGEEPLITISNKLIEMAAQKIETASFYNRDDCFNCVVAALRFAGQTITRMIQIDKLLHDNTQLSFAILAKC